MTTEAEVIVMEGPKSRDVDSTEDGRSKETDSHLEPREGTRPC